MAQLKDGWHVVYGENVFVENGKVTLSSYRAGYKNGTKCMK